MEFVKEEGYTTPVSPIAQYFNSSSLSVELLCVLETTVEIDTSQTFQLIRDVFLPINPRFSSIMVSPRLFSMLSKNVMVEVPRASPRYDKNGIRVWRKYDINLKEHVKVPAFPSGLSPEVYEEYSNEYFSGVALESLQKDRALWEIHILKYPTTNSAGSIIFKLHHALGDGYSLMGALLTQMERADNPTIPLTFPSRQSALRPKKESRGIFRRVPRVLTGAVNSVVDFGWDLVKSTFLDDRPNPVHSGRDGLDFHPMEFTRMSFSLEDLKLIKGGLKATINDVMVGIVFLGTRMYMKSAGEEFGTALSTGLVLLNTRALGGYKSITEMLQPNAEMPWGNHFAFLHISVPPLQDSDFSNPLKFVLEARKLILRKKNSPAVYFTGFLLEAMRKIRGAEETAKYIRSTLKNSSIIMTNMIGPIEQMSIANHPIGGFYFSATGCPQGLAVTIVSYMGKLNVVFRTERGLIDSVKYKSCIQNSFDMMMKASGHSK